MIILLVVTYEHGRDIGTGIGSAGFFLGIAYFFISLLLMISAQTRKVGMTVLLSAGIIFLIGLGLCSAYPMAFH